MIEKHLYIEEQINLSLQQRTKQIQLFMASSPPQKLTISEPVVGHQIQYLIQNTFQEVRLRHLIENLPLFIQVQLSALITQKTLQSSPEYGTTKPSSLEQQLVESITKIQKDNLLPKELQSTTLQIKQLPENLSIALPKSLTSANRSHILRRKPSQTTQLPYNHQGTHEKPVVSKNLLTKKNPLQNFTPLDNPEQEDPTIDRLREKVGYKREQDQKEKNYLLQRVKQQNQRKSYFEQTFKGRDYTFQYGGDTIQTQKQQTEMVFYRMKVGNKTLNRKFRTVYSKDRHQNKSMELKIPKRTDRCDYKQQLNASSQIPVFELGTHRNSFLEPDPRKLQIQEYKKLYGRRFSRFGTHQQTIDLLSVTDKNQGQEQLFGEKKHLRDTSNLLVRESISIEPKTRTRNLVLPRLQGKYKVLDRYGDL